MYYQRCFPAWSLVSSRGSVLNPEEETFICLSRARVFPVRFDFGVTFPRAKTELVDVGGTWWLDGSQ